MIRSGSTTDPTHAAPRVARRNRPSRDGLRATAALWAFAAVFQLAAPTPALAQSGDPCVCKSSDGSPWWLALLPAGAAGLLGLLPGGRAAAAAPAVVVPPVERPDLVAPPPLAAPPAEVGAPPVVAPRAPGSDVRIPIGGKRRPVTPPSAYNGPVPRFKVLRQLLGVPESAVAAARARETGALARPAARVVPAKAPARPGAAPSAAAPAPRPATPTGHVASRH